MGNFKAPRDDSGELLEREKSATVPDITGSVEGRPRQKSRPWRNAAPAKIKEKRGQTSHFSLILSLISH